MYFPTITLLALLPTLLALPYPAQQPRGIAAIGIEPSTQVPTSTSTSIPDAGIKAIGRAIGAIAIEPSPTSTIPEVGINAIGRAIGAIAIEPSSSTASTTGKEVGINAIGRAIGAIAEHPSPTPSTVLTLNAIGRAIAILPTHKPVKPNAIGRAIAAIAVEESPSSSTTSETSEPTFGVDAIGRAIGAIGIIRPSAQPSGVKPQAIGRDLNLYLERRAIGAIGIKPSPQPSGVKVQAIGRDLEGRAIAAIGGIGLPSTTTTSARVEETGVKVDAIEK